MGVPNTRLFGVLWPSLSTVVLGSPKNFPCGKLDGSLFCLCCGKIASRYFVEKMLSGYFLTFTCIGRHIYARIIFGNFVKMAVLLYIFVCMHILCSCFSNMSVLPFSINYADYGQKSNSRLWSSQIPAIYMAWDFSKKEKESLIKALDCFEITKHFNIEAFSCTRFADYKSV